MRKIAYGILALILSLPAAAFGSSGCTYPTTHDLWTDKIAGDFLTIADVNQFRCAIEKLESGPVRPTDGSVSAPAFSFRDDTNTGIFRGGADLLDFTTGGTLRARIDASGRWMLGTTNATGAAAGDMVFPNNRSVRFVRADGVQSTNFYIHGSPQDNIEMAVPAGTDEYVFNWGTSTGIKLLRTSPGGAVYFVGESVNSDHATPAAGDAVLYVRDNGAGKTQLMVRWPQAGAISTIATEP